MIKDKQTHIKPVVLTDEEIKQLVSLINMASFKGTGAEAVVRLKRKLSKELGGSINEE